MGATTLWVEPMRAGVLPAVGLSRPSGFSRRWRAVSVCVLCDENLRRDTQTFVQVSDHAQREGAFVVEPSDARQEQYRL